ncbi:AAA family ATPase [Methanoplanus limicola]|uniref:Uncharacterized protein n=1 Tax=Methanoplanus limicola DSM 2279 TaxID=937775 RepID=H1Z1G2_9EURY|nr:AAA family ATPase [Methanoplanus limicola]EHQ36309.1 hypothetical protein Metlim_2250 [Methanoplanus limicola DSM 2279]
MKIKSISVCNYKCHRIIENLPFHEFTTLIGENDSGKTAIIDFLEIMLTNAIPKFEDYYRYLALDPQSGHDHEVTAEDISGEVIFIVDEDEIMDIPDYLDENGCFRLKKEFTSEDNHTYLYTQRYSDERFYNYKKMNANDLGVFVEELRLSPKEGTKFNNQDERKTAVKDYIQIKSQEIPSSLDWHEINFKDIQNFLPKLIRYNVDDYNNPENLIFKVLKESFEDELYCKDQNGIKKLRDQKIQDAMDRAKERLNEESGQFLKHLQKFNRRIDSISIEPEIDLTSGLKQTPVKIKEKYEPYQYLNNKGYGTKRRMYLAIFEWNKEVLSGIDQDYAIRCYDEPDNNLHIEAQRSLFRTLRSVVDDSKGKNQVILCTHSLFMIDSVSSSSINLLRNCHGSTEIDYLKSDDDPTIQEFISLMCREMGLSNSHLFFEKCFIIIEGPTESNFIPQAYRKLYNSSMAEDGITLIELGGNGAALNFLKLLMKNKSDLIILFLDNDTKRIRREKLLTDDMISSSGMTESDYRMSVDNFFKERLIYIGEKEFEDTFSNEVILSVLNRYRPKKDEKLWIDEDIRKMREKNKFSDEIISCVAKECKPNYLNKPELGTFLASLIEKEDIPQTVKDLFSKARDISGVEFL